MKMNKNIFFIKILIYHFGFYEKTAGPFWIKIPIFFYQKRGKNPAGCV
jgi:hypothetical protein